MKLLIIGSKKSRESKQLVKEAITRKHTVRLVPIKNLVFKKTGKDLKVYWKNNDISYYDVVLFRAINQHINEAGIAARYMQKMEKVPVDKVVADYIYDFHKLLMHECLSQKSIPQPKTFQVLDIKGLKTAIKELKLPLIVKYIKGLRGKQVYRFDSKKEIVNFFKNKKNYNFLIQEWLPQKKYYRIFVIGKRVIGAIERLSLKCKNRPILSLPKRSKETIVDKRVKGLAIKAARACKTEIAGVDIMYKNNKPLVLEVNRSPRFYRFQKVTKINVAKKIIKYLEKKCNKNVSKK